ncbi:hypothetical protein P3L10_033268 [Capsicum annuum]
MTTLADSFLAELDELDDNTTDVHEHMEKDGCEKLAFNYHDDDEYDLDNVLKLRKSRHYIDIMQKLKSKMPYFSRIRVTFFLKQMIQNIS